MHPAAATASCSNATPAAMLLLLYIMGFYALGLLMAYTKHELPPRWPLHRVGWANRIADWWDRVTGRSD
jgi:hypothetical protein